jgi:hypothetical protein
LKSTTATPSTAAPLGPDIDPDALLVLVDALSMGGGLVTEEKEVDWREADEEDGKLVRHASLSFTGEVY